MATITWLTKIDGFDLDDPQKNVSAADMNQIKSAVNTNDSETTTALGLRLLTSSLVFNETPTGLVNGSNMVYTIANTPIAGTVIASADAQPLREGFDFNISGTTLTMTWPPEDWIRINLYRK